MIIWQRFKQRRNNYDLKNIHYTVLLLAENSRKTLFVGSFNKLITDKLIADKLIYRGFNKFTCQLFASMVK